MDLAASSVESGLGTFKVVVDACGKDNPGTARACPVKPDTILPFHLA